LLGKYLCHALDRRNIATICGFVLVGRGGRNWFR